MGLECYECVKRRLPARRSLRLSPASKSLQVSSCWQARRTRAHVIALTIGPRRCGSMRRLRGHRGRREQRPRPSTPATEDGLRHPASITKVMTLYLLFEQLEQRPDDASDEHPRLRRTPQPRSRRSLALRPVQHDQRRQTPSRRSSPSRPTTSPSRSAESIGGTESDFAQMMTAQGPRPRHDAHELRQCIRPARRAADHHGEET